MLFQVRDLRAACLTCESWLPDGMRIPYEDFARWIAPALKASSLGSVTQVRATADVCSVFPAKPKRTPHELKTTA